jgi:L-fuconolactonase
MPGFPIVDTHVHFWDLAQNRYPWLEAEPRLNWRHGPAEYQAACQPVQVGGLVFVEAGAAPACALAEARWVASLADQEPRLKGIVAAAALERGDNVRPHLAELASIPLVKGVRRLLQDEADDRYCLRPSFVRGVEALAEFGFSFDICVRHWQLAGVIELVRRCPTVPFMLDHVAKPDIRGRGLSPWREQLRELARLPNVTCKVSGMVTEADHNRWTREDLKPYIDHVLDCFGFGRVAYGSDWPVSTLAARYPQWVEALDWALAGCADADLRQLFCANGTRFYRLA